LRQQAEGGIRHRLFWGFGAQGLALVLRILQQIALVPILISAWGPELYSDWIIVYAAATSLSFLDLGIQVYFGNALLIARSRGDIPAYRRQFGIATSAYVIILLVTGLSLAAASLSAPWQGLLSTHLMSEATVNATFMILAVATLLLIPFGLVTAVYRAYGDYAHAGVISTSTDALRGIGICVVSLIGGDPVSAATVYLAVALMFWMIVVVDQRKRYGEFPFALTAPMRSELKSGAIGSALYIIPTLATPLALNGPILLLGALGAMPGAIVAFAVCRTFTGFVRQLVHQLCHPIGAELSRQQATADLTRMKLVFIGSGRLLSGLAGLLSGLTVVVAEPFLRIWTRGEVLYDPWLVGFFLLSIVAAAPSQVALMMFHYNNQPRVLITTHASYAVLSLVLCAVLIGPFAAAGAAAAVGIAELASLGFFLPRAATSAIGLSLYSYFSRCGVVATLGFCLGLGCAWALDWAMSPSGLLSLFALSLFWAILVSAPAVFILLAPPERAWVSNLLRRSWANTTAGRSS
jgi:O-antigen/teichoic acid export membrane protein